MRTPAAIPGISAILLAGTLLAQTGLYTIDDQGTVRAADYVNGDGVPDIEG